MIILGNMVTEKRIKNKLDFIELVNPNEFDINNIILPTLIIGYENAKNLLGDKLRILDRKVSDNLFWTFGKTEKRIYYDEDILNFYKSIINNLLHNIEYRSISLFKLSLTDLKRLYTKITTYTNYIFSSYHTIYIYDKGNVVFGLSYDEFEYANVDRKKILKLIMSNKNNVVELNDSFLSLETQKVFREHKYLYPYLMSQDKIKQKS